MLSGSVLAGLVDHPNCHGTRTPDMVRISGSGEVGQPTAIGQLCSGLEWPIQLPNSPNSPGGCVLFRLIAPGIRIER